MSKEEFDALAVIAMRKSDFYRQSRDILLKRLPPSIDKAEVKVALRSAISELDNSLFIGRNEKETKRIDPSTPLAKLDLDNEKIVKEILHRIGPRQPEK